MSTKPLLLNVRSRDVNDTQQQRYIGTELNRPISACLFFISLPIFILNTCLALVNGRAVFEYYKKQDSLDRSSQYQRFSSGLLKSLPMLWAVFTQRISLCGMPVDLEPSKKQKARLQSYSFIPAG